VKRQRPRIAFFMRPEPRDADAPEVKANVSAVSDEIVAGLREAGAEVEEIVPEAQAWDLVHLAPAHDLYVLKSKNPLDLDLAESLERAGARVVNAAQASRLVKDKIVHTTLLARAGVLQPQSWTVASLAALRDLLVREPGACLVKPPAGSMAAGIYSLTCAEDLDKEEMKELREAFVDEFGQPRPLLVQRTVASDGKDLKVYVVGEWVAAVERMVGARTEAEKRGTAMEVAAEIREAALACGRTLGLEIYGVDFMRSPDDGRFWVVDVNAFPSFRGIEGASERIVRLLMERATAM
jgi:ribosomal protein S6--L-glutamate ligase